MNVRRYTTLTVVAAFALSLPIAALAQSATQDMKNAGSDTKHAATSAGHGVKKGTEKGYSKTKSGTKKAYHKTKHATKTGVHKVEGKPNTPANNPQ